MAGEIFMETLSRVPFFDSDSTLSPREHYQLSVFKHEKNRFRMKQIQSVVLKNEGKYVINKTFISNSISVLGWSAGECLF